MSISGHDVGPITPPSTWKPAGTGTRTSVQDRISLFETNPATAGNTKASNLATSHHFRRWSSSGTINFATDNEVSSNGIDNKGRGFSRPHHRLHTFSVEDCYQEEQEGEQGVISFPEMMLQARRAEIFASTRNQELNRRLQMKADELERMFAEHKRRIYGGGSTEAKAAVVEEKMEKKLDIVRGSVYERYMEKRDAKRREEWGRNREQKEAKARAMWESVEMSRAELMASYNQRLQDASVDISLADRSSARKKDQNPISFVLAEEEEDKQSSDDSLKSINSKMLTSRSMSSSTSRISGAVVSRLSSKLPSSRSLRGSVTNTNFRKENKKPSTGISKANAHAQPSSITRSRSTSAGVNYFEEKPPRSASLRKSSVTPLTPLQTTKELSRPKPFLKKGSGAGLSKLRTSDSSELNDQQPESPGPNLNGDVYNQALCPQEALADYDIAALDSPCGSTSSWFSQDGARVRKKWGSVQVPVLVPDGSHQSPKVLKRFLHFGKKSRGVDSKVADWASVSAVSGPDYDMEVGRDMVSEQIRNSSMGCPVHSYDGFSFCEGMSLPEPVQTPRRSSISTPANLKLRKDLLSESTPKSPRSFFSLSAFRNKGVESKLR